MLYNVHYVLHNSARRRRRRRHNRISHSSTMMMLIMIFYVGIFIVRLCCGVVWYRLTTTYWDDPLASQTRDKWSECTEHTLDKSLCSVISEQCIYGCAALHPPNQMQNRYGEIMKSTCAQRPFHTTRTHEHTCWLVVFTERHILWKLHFPTVLCAVLCAADVHTSHRIVVCIIFSPERTSDIDSI